MAQRKPAERAKTMDDIARLANVSKPTVSRALRDSPLVTKETKERVLAVARRHGYRVNRNAQKLRHKRTDTVAVVLDFPSHRGKHISDPFIFDLLAGVAAALAERNQDLLLCSPKLDDAGSYQDVLVSKGADGIIFLGQGHREAALKALAQSDAPFVVWGAVTGDLPYCAVGSDNFRGGMLAGAHLVKAGRRRLLFLGDASFLEIGLRRQGMREGVRRAGQGGAIADLALDDFGYESYFAGMSAYLTRAAPPDGIFACSDTIAMAAIDALRQAGLKVPGDVSVVGYNDIASAAYFQPPLTTVRQDIGAAGELLVAKLMALVEGARPASVMLETKLIVRAS
ncbi:MAG: LacI family DNA-binding transcriptional regulator [Pseudomonadota bacterium]